MGTKKFPSQVTADTEPTVDTYVLGSGGKIKLSDLIGQGVGVNKVTITGHGQFIEADNGFARITSDWYTVLSAPSAPCVRYIYGDTGFHLVPIDHGGAGLVTINGVADIVVFDMPGLYVLECVSEIAWKVSPAADYDAIDTAIATAVSGKLDAGTFNARNLTAGNGLTGGGQLSADRSFAVGQGAGIQVNADDVAIATGGVTLAMINSAVKSAAQGTESLRQIDTATPAAIGTAAAGSSVKAAASDHVHALMSSGTADFGSAAITTTGNVTGSLLKSGSGSPESSVTATVGALYRDTSSGRVYMKMSGSGNTGWVGMTPDGVDPAQIQIIASGTTATIGDHVRWVFIATGSGNFTLTGAAIVIGKEVEIQKTSTDANTIMYGRAGSENVQGAAANYPLPLSSAANYPAYSVKDIDATNRWVS